MSDPTAPLPPSAGPQAPRRPVHRVARVLVPIGAVAVAFGGFAIAYAATDSGTDTPHDVAERGLDPANPSVDADTPPATDAPNAASSTQPSETTTFDTVNLPDGAMQTFTAGAAGTVTISRSGTTLTVVAVAPNAAAGWSTDIEQASGPQVEVEFRNGTARIDFEAEFEDGAVRVRVRERNDAIDNDDEDVTPPTSPTSPTTRIDNSGPGSVNSGHDGDDDGANHDVGDDSGSHSGSGSSGSGSSGSGSSGSGSSDSGSGSSGSGSSGSGSSGSGSSGSGHSGSDN